MDSVQLRHGQRPCARGGSQAPSFSVATTGWFTTWTRTRPTLVVPSPARLSQFATTAAALKSRPAPAPARAVAGSDVETSSISAQQVLQGKLLMQSFVDSPNSPLRLSLQLVSATVAGSDGRGVRGDAAALDAVIGSGETEHGVELPWDEALVGAPGAVLITNHSDFPVYLKLLSVSSPATTDAPVHFVCNGWIYPAGKHPYRLFFTNDTYVKEKTPGALLKYREDELSLLRGDSASTDEPFQEWDRVYDYALYNDLGNPDLRKDLARPVLGGSEEYPYPRRARTNRPPTKTDPESEARAPLDQEIYVPCDERDWPPGVAAPNLPKFGDHFKSFADIYSLFGLDDLGRLAQVKEAINSNAGTRMPTFPVPQVISANPRNWRTDEEFAREMLAGSNPVAIKRVTEFPLTSELDRGTYGDQDSKITKDHIEKNMGTTTVAQAIQEGRLYVVDHHDWVMPYLERINELPGAEDKDEISQRKAYAARTLLFLQDDSTLKPLAIELSSPHPEEERLGAVSTVYTPPDTSRDVSAGSFTPWELAKAHAAVNDACKSLYVHHWLKTHASMEPLVIATNRQLSVLHPIHKLLKPHFLNTMKINATARQIAVASGDRRKNGDMFRCIYEVMFCTGKYGMEMSSKAYKTWNFTELALPNDLIKRGLARGDPKNPDKLELLIKDYPYAVDGLDIWMAIKEWVTDYCAIYYADDGAVTGDSELQGWWREVRHVGHGDLRDAPWWPALDCVGDLVEACATIIWVGSAYHAAVSFGQYAYQGFAPNRPTITSRQMPDDAEAEVTEAEFLGSITPRSEALAFIAVNAAPPVKPGEPLLGQRLDKELWTSERLAAEALAEFRTKLETVAQAIAKRNADSKLRNRSGPVEVPYTLLTPTTEPGAHVTGIPNSIAV